MLQDAVSNDYRCRYCNLSVNPLLKGQNPYVSSTGDIDGFCPIFSGADVRQTAASSAPRTFILQNCCAMDEWPVWRSCTAAIGLGLKGRFGPAATTCEGQPGAWPCGAASGRLEPSGVIETDDAAAYAQPVTEGDLCTEASIEPHLAASFGTWLPILFA